MGEINRNALSSAKSQVLRVAGLSPLAVTISTDTAAPVVAGVRLRPGRAGSSRGAASMVTEAINTAIEAGARPENILVRGDSAYCAGKIVAAVVKAGARFSFAIAHNPAVAAAIASIPDDAYVPVDYPGAVTDPRHRGTPTRAAPTQPRTDAWLTFWRAVFDSDDSHRPDRDAPRRIALPRLTRRAAPSKLDTGQQDRSYPPSKDQLWNAAKPAPLSAHGLGRSH